MHNKKELAKKLEKYFGMIDGGKFIDKTFELIGEISIDTIGLDEWLHEQFPDYEEKLGLSMKQLIEEKYSKEASKFVENHM